MIRVFTVLAITLTGLLPVTGCSSGPVQQFDGFKAAQKPGHSILYLLRPCNLNLGVHSFSGSIIAYDGHFSDGRENPVADYSFKPCEYATIEVSPGFLKVQSDGFGKHSAILNVKQDLHFVALYQSAPDAFTIPEVFPTEIDKEKAAFHLTQYQGMNYKPVILR